MKSFCFVMLILTVLSFSACTEEKPAKVEVPDTVPEPELQIVRLDLIFQEFIRKGKNLQESEVRAKLRGHEPFLREWLFSGDTTVSDTLFPALVKYFCQDPRSAQLVDSVVNHFPPEYDFKGILAPALRRFQYLFPEEKIPVIYFYVTGYQPNSGLKDQSYLSEKYLGISLDYFMGEEFPFYPGDLPKFMRRRCRPEYLPVAAMQHFAEYLHRVPDISESPMFLDYVISLGIRQNFLEAVLPEVSDSVRLSYTSAQMAFVREYEANIYKELIPVLYSTDYMKFEKYLSDKPFTPNLSQESADRLAVFLGWKVVAEYLKKHPQILFPDLMKNYNHKRIFEEAKYKP